MLKRDLNEIKADERRSSKNVSDSNVREGLLFLLVRAIRGNDTSRKSRAFRPRSSEHKPGTGTDNLTISSHY